MTSSSTQKLFGIFVVCFAALILFAATAPTTIPEGDSGEFLLLAKFPGIAHPPGYPLYVGLARLVARYLPESSLVLNVSFISVVAGGLGAGIYFVALLELTGSFFAAVAATVFTFLAAATWRTANGVEPFGLNLVLLSTLFWSSWKLIQGRQISTAALLLGLVSGAALANHHTLVLFLPLAAVGLLYAGKKRTLRPVQLSLVLLGFVLGALPLALLLAPTVGAPLSWGQIENVRQLWDHVIRADYGTWRLSASAPSDALRMPLYFLRSLPGELSFVGVGLLFLAPIGAWRLRREVSGSGLFIAANLLVIGSVFLFFRQFNVDINGPGETIVYRFVHLGVIALGVFIALGAREFFLWFEGERAAAVGMLCLFSLFHLSLQYPKSDRRRETFAEWDVKNTLLSVQNAKTPVVVTLSDAEFMGLLYGKHILGRSTHVTIFQPAMWGADWYRRKMADELKLEPAAQKGAWTNAISSLISSHQVFLTHPYDAEARPLMALSYPFGRLVRLVDSAKKIPPRVELHEINARLFAWDYSLPIYDYNPWEMALYRRYYDPQSAFGMMHRTEKIADLEPGIMMH